MLIFILFQGISMKKTIVLMLLASVVACKSYPVQEIEVDDEVYYREIEASITPDVYAIAAARVTNKMLDQSGYVYQKPDPVLIYITDPKKLDDRLPDGLHAARKVTRDIISGSKNYKVTNDMNEADYYLQVLVDNIGTEFNPIISYKLILFDKNNVEVDEWVETLKRVKNDDRSWW